MQRGKTRTLGAMNAARTRTVRGWVSIATILVGALLTTVIALAPELAPCPYLWYFEPTALQMLLCQLSTTVLGAVATALLIAGPCVAIAWVYLASKRGTQPHGT